MKKPKGSFKLRSLYGNWYVIKTRPGETEQRVGPLNYETAKVRCDTLERLGWTNGDAGS